MLVLRASLINFLSLLSSLTQPSMYVSSHTVVRPALLFGTIHGMHAIVLPKGLLHRCLEI